MSYSPNTPINSTKNSTVVALAGAATFTGVAELSPRGEVLVQSYSDVAGTLYFDFSIDGTNFDSTFPVAGFNCSAGIPEVHRAVVSGRYFRVRYTNGASAQATFRLGTSFASIGLLAAPLNQTYGLDADSIVVRPTLSWLDISRGLAVGMSHTKKFGRNPNVGTSFVPISIGGIYQVPQSGSATTLRIKSGGNANDTSAGSGAREVTLVGLDENFEEVTESVATSGTSASSATTATFTRLYRAYVSSSGTYASASAGSHSGDIVIENSAGGTDWATIDSTDFPKGQSEIGAFSVSAGKTGYVKLRNLSVDSGKTIDLIFFSRENIDDTSAPYSAMRVQSVVSGVTGGSIEPFGDIDVPFGPYIGPTDLGFMGKASTGSGSISVEFEIFVIEE